MLFKPNKNTHSQIVDEERTDKKYNGFDSKLTKKTDREGRRKISSVPAIYNVFQQLVY